MLRFILKSEFSDGQTPNIIKFQTLLLEVSELECLLRAGGYGNGHLIYSLVGVEVLDDKQETEADK